MNIADAAPQPSMIIPGAAIACLIIVGLVVTGVVTLVVWLVRRNREARG